MQGREGERDLVRVIEKEGYGVRLRERESLGKYFGFKIKQSAKVVCEPFSQQLRSNPHVNPLFSLFLILTDCY